MQYRDFGKTGIKVSVLGAGCMRFPLNSDGSVNEKETTEMLRRAVDSGLNYIDTAYVYHDQKSEEIVGRALQGGYREKVHIATKSPVWLINCPEDFDTMLDTQLRRLGTNYIDFYLLHSLSRDSWENKVLKFGLLDKIQQAKKKGLVKHIGFSFHDNFETFVKIVDSLDCWDFCQIQFNYVDVHDQATIDGLKYAHNKGLGVVIMEPIRGGRLADPPSQLKTVLDADKPYARQALDFVWNFPEVSVVLSGMSNMEQINQNIQWADESRAGKLSPADLEMYAKAEEIWHNAALVPCTKCGYCMPCPFGLDIPAVYEAYNMTVSQSKKEASAVYDKIPVKADACKKCGKCDKICPQHISAREHMPKISELFSN